MTTVGFWQLDKREHDIEHDIETMTRRDVVSCTEAIFAQIFAQRMAACGDKRCQVRVGDFPIDV